MFYFDEKLKEYEATYSWDKALTHLENLFIESPTCEKLNSLVGFSWYYLIEGPIDSGKYGKDENSIALDIWEKYLDIGFEKYSDSPSFCFIAGYSLLMHGFYMNKYRSNNEQVGTNLLNKVKNSNADRLKVLVSIVLEHQNQKTYKPLKINQEVPRQIFVNESLLEGYFLGLFQ